MVVYASIIILLVILSGVFTVMIGNSKTNREGNPNYDQRTGGNIVRLTTLYVIAGIIGVAVMIYMIF
ncbi:hypothetical protein [Paenibacillus ginsengarvi]|uniref:Uncharacterized protein n=1 Tax=Paenibacillus ginsengarvi TaxID=400777 RepID=A0A3B0AYJ7_9BACL|nr:hypothetical protein [Paenibacillus ginsengarvi]RKN65460.1 hypothetical protein D7M11_32375 [Paenibacillus ginsengarvi]